MITKASWCKGYTQFLTNNTYICTRINIFRKTFIKDSVHIKTA